MKFELRKILRNRYFIGILLLAVFANAFLLFSTYDDDSCGYTLCELKEAYESIDFLEQKQTDLFSAILGLSDYQGELITEDIYEENALVIDALERIAEAGKYGDTLNDIIAELNVKVNSGLFGNIGSYSVKAFQAVLRYYEKLQGLDVPVTFSGSVEALSGWSVSDILIQLFCCTAALLLMTSERANSSLSLLYTTKHGRAKLFTQKYMALEGIFAITFLLMHGGNLAVTGLTLGFGDITRPIQAIYGFSECPFPFTVLGYFVFFYSIKFLWGICISTLFFALCSVTDKYIVPIMAMGTVLLISYACEVSGNLHLYCLNLIHLANTASLFQDCIMLNIAGQPISHFDVLFFELGLISLITFGLGIWIFCKKQVVSRARARKNGRGLSIYRHTNLFGHEGIKILFYNRALLFLAAFALLQLCIYQNYTISLNETEQEYRRYSAVLSGAPSEEKDIFISEETVYFEDLEKQMVWLEEQFSDNDAVLSLVTRDIEQELLRKEGFSQAKNQYDSLQNGMSYVYRAGYQRMTNTQGTKDDIRNTALFIFFLLLILSDTFSFEDETGVCTIHNTLGVYSKVMVRKWLHIICILFLMWIIAYLPQYIVINQRLGLNELGALAHSLSYFSRWPGNWTIAMVLIATNLMRFIAGLLSAVATYFVAKKVGSTSITLLISFGMFVVPLVIAFLFI